MNFVNKNPTYFFSQRDGSDPKKIINTIPYDKVTLLDIVGEGAFGQVYRGMYINIINTITYDKVTLLDIIGEGAFDKV